MLHYIDRILIDFTARKCVSPTLTDNSFQTKFEFHYSWNSLCMAWRPPRLERVRVLSIRYFSNNTSLLTIRCLYINIWLKVGISIFICFTTKVKLVSMCNLFEVKSSKIKEYMLSPSWGQWTTWISHLATSCSTGAFASNGSRITSSSILWCPVGSGLKKR